MLIAYTYLYMHIACTYLYMHIAYTYLYMLIAYTYLYMHIARMHPLACGRGGRLRAATIAVIRILRIEGIYMEV